jgi:protocatechuate 3,4-dioxygenase beta subunit
VKPNKKFSLIRQTATAPNGKYYFNNVHPGQYVLRIGGIDYPLEVRETQMQDIPVIAPPRHCGACSCVRARSPYERAAAN